MGLFKKEEPLLYAGFRQKERENELDYERLMKEMDESDFQDKPSDDAEDNACPAKQAKVQKVSYRGRANIYVTSLSHGAGCTFISYLLAYQFAKRGHVALVETAGYDFKVPNALDVYYAPCDLMALHQKHYEYLIRDCGLYGEIKESVYSGLVGADYKIMVCHPDQLSLKSLASIIEQLPDLEHWYFFFTQVPDGLASELETIMEDYNAYIIPCVMLEQPGKEFLKIFRAVFGKE